jgi:5-methylthioadenosine/S-adenosylhomocysteine deaminase
MRARQVLTIDVPQVMQQAQHIAHQIDAFVVAREGSVLDKLVAIGGLAQEETYEVQVKIPVDAPQAVTAGLGRPEIVVERSSVRRQYDTYFSFGDTAQGRIRYREDEILDEGGQVKEVRYSLTLTGPSKEREFPHSVLLSRSRFTARATRSRRFYREYFRPIDEREVHKERQRWHIRYKDTEFALNLDRLLVPERPDWFLEIKSRTWSPRDAEVKANLITELLQLLDLHDRRVTRSEYADF